jgi:hypothetical protein
LVLIWKKLWGIWVYTWVRGIVIPGLGLFVCLFVVCVCVYPFFFGGVPPCFPSVLLCLRVPLLAFSSWAVRSLPPVRPRGGRVGFLPASGFSAPFLVGFSYVFSFFRSCFGSCCLWRSCFLCGPSWFGSGAFVFLCSLVGWCGGVAPLCFGLPFSVWCSWSSGLLVLCGVWLFGLSCGPFFWLPWWFGFSCRW